MLALITGASAGFGAATARLLVQHGHRVIITARRQERLHVLQQELGQNCLALAFDVCDEEATLGALHSLPPEWQEIDLLINNAGLALGIEAAQKSKLQDWKQMIATNIGGLITLTHAILPGMVARNRGHIINLGSIAGDYPYPGGNVYGATKAFVKQFSLNLRADLVGTAVRVSNVEPSFPMCVFMVTIIKLLRCTPMWIISRRKILPKRLFGLPNVRRTLISTVSS